MCCSQITGALSFAIRGCAAEPLRSSSKMDGQDKKNEHGLSIGDRVQLYSLLRLPELNSVCGKIVRPQDPSTGRVKKTNLTADQMNMMERVRNKQTVRR